MFDGLEAIAREFNDYRCQHEHIRTKSRDVESSDVKQQTYSFHLPERLRREIFSRDSLPVDRPGNACRLIGHLNHSESGTAMMHTLALITP